MRIDYIILNCIVDRVFTTFVPINIIKLEHSSVAVLRDVVSKEEIIIQAKICPNKKYVIEIMPVKVAEVVEGIDDGNRIKKYER